MKARGKAMKGRAAGARLWRALRVLSLVALLVAVVSSVGAAERVSIGHAAMQPRVAPLWVAADRGLFAQEGVEVTIVLINGAPTLLASLTARELQFGYTGGSTVLAAFAGGLPVKMLAAFTNKVSFDFVARPGITRPEELRGKRVGVQSIGGPLWMGAMLGLEYLGLEPVRDKIHIQVVGAQPQLVQALRQIRHLQDFPEVGIEPVHQTARGRTRHDDAVDAEDLESGQRFRDRRHLGQQVDALAFADGKHLQLARLDVRQMRRQHIEHNLHPPGEQIDLRRLAALVGHMNHVDSGPGFQQLHA